MFAVTFFARIERPPSSLSACCIQRPFRASLGFVVNLGVARSSRDIRGVSCCPFDVSSQSPLADFGVPSSVPFGCIVGLVESRWMLSLVCRLSSYQCRPTVLDACYRVCASESAVSRLCHDTFFSAYARIERWLFLLFLCEDTLLVYCGVRVISVSRHSCQAWALYLPSASGLCAAASLCLYRARDYSSSFHRVYSRVAVSLRFSQARAAESDVISVILLVLSPRSRCFAPWFFFLSPCSYRA